MIGYTISPLDSNESILEKLNKLEKYLKDNKMYNLYTTSFEFYDNTTDFIPDATISNPALNTIAEGDLAIYKYNGATIVGVIIAVGSGGITVDRYTEQVLADDTLIQAVNIVSVSTNTFKIQITDTKGNVYESGEYTVAGGSGAGIDSITVTESSGSATITIEDTDGNQFTSNSFTVGEQNTDTLIDTITVTESSGSATITIEDTAGNQYTSNSFNVGGGGGSETVYVDSNDSIVSSNATTTTSESVVLGDGALSQGNWGVAVGVNSTVRDVSGISIGNYSEAKGSKGIAIGVSSLSRNDSIVIGHNSNVTAVDTSTNNGIAIGNYATISGNYCTAIGNDSVAGTDVLGTHTAYCTAIGYGAKAKEEESVQIGSGTNNTPYSIQFKSHQIASEENTTLKLSNELQLNNHLITIISMSNDFATASANGIQVTVDQNDSTHEQVQNLNHPTTDTSILEDEQVLAIYNYTDMTDPDNPVSEFTLCYAMFVNYDSVNNVCDCMVLRMGPTQTM